MSFIYEVNGQRVEFEKEPTEKDIDEAALSLKVKPVSQQQKPVEGAGGAAFGVYRPQGRRPESQQDREASKDMPLQTARGVATGTLGAIPDLLNLPGTIYSGVTGNEAPYKVPLGSEEWNQMLPFQSDTPQARLARFGGEVLAPIPTIKGAKAIARAPGQVYRAGQEFTQGAMEGLRNPVYNPISPTRSFDPLKETYYPTPQVQAFQNAPVASRPGMLPQLEASQQPSSSLFNSPTELLATALGPKTAQGQNLIPYQGQTTKAFGETVGRDIATEPYKRAGLPTLAGATIGGIAGGPFGAMLGAGFGAALNPMLRGAELYSLNKLGKTAGFLPGFPEQLAQAQGRAGIQGQIPQTPLLTNNPSAPGPVNPNTMFVSPEGVAGTNINQVSQAGAQQKYAPQPVPQTPQQMAIQKTQEIVNQQAPQVDPAKLNDILAQVRARTAAKQTSGQPQPTPVAGPIAPTAIQSLPSNRWTPAEKLALERANIQEQSPTVMSAADEVQMKKEIEQSASQYRGQVVTEWAKGNRLVEGVPLDKSKNAYDGSNRTRGQVKQLLAAGIDEIPVLDGVTPAQTIDAMVTHLDNKKRASQRQSNVLEMKIDDGSVGGSTLDQSVIAKRSFNENLEKYRYGSPKDPLTVEEYNHITNSDFIEKQNIFDSIKGMNPDYIEHSFWYKDKDGTVINVAPDPTGSLTITKIDKNNPNKETSYSKSNPDREDEWSFVKMESDNSGRKITESFQVKGTTSPRHEKLKNWPAEFTNSKYDME